MRDACEGGGGRVGFTYCHVLTSLDILVYWFTTKATVWPLLLSLITDLFT